MTGMLPDGCGVSETMRWAIERTKEDSAWHREEGDRQEARLSRERAQRLENHLMQRSDVRPGYLIINFGYRKKG